MKKDMVLVNLAGALAIFGRNFLGRSQPIEKGYEEIGRNDPCPCRSGEKFKDCCLHRKSSWFLGFTLR